MEAASAADLGTKYRKKEIMINELTSDMSNNHKNVEHDADKLDTNGC